MLLYGLLSLLETIIFTRCFSAKVKENRQRTGKKQYTNTKEIKNDTPKRAYGRLERTRDLWALLRLLDFPAPT